MRYLYIYITPDDVISLAQHVESGCPLQYMQTGNFTAPPNERFLRCEDIPNIGLSSNNQSAFSATYLTVPFDAQINIRQLPGVGGVTRFLVDQLINPDSILFQPAGPWKDDFVIEGTISTVSDTAIAQDLMKRFRAAFKPCGFKKLDRYYLGPQAFQMFEEGKRLVQHEKAPPEYDLRQILAAKQAAKG